MVLGTGNQTTQGIVGTLPDKGVSVSHFLNRGKLTVSVVGVLQPLRGASHAIQRGNQPSQEIVGVVGGVD